MRKRAMDKRTLLAAFCALLLAGCGPGTEGVAESGNEAPVGISLSGTAAIGDAIDARPVNAVCSDGKHYSSVSLSSHDGSFALNVAQGALPCALEIDTGLGYRLHSLALQAGTVNITPLTDLALAIGLIGSNTPGDWFDALKTNSAPTPNLSVLASQLDQLASSLKQKLASAGFGLGAEFGNLDIFNGSFVVGDRADQLLDALQQAIAANSTYPGYLLVLRDNAGAPLPAAPADYGYDDPDVEPPLSLDDDFTLPVGGSGNVGCACITGIQLGGSSTAPISGY